MCSVQLDLITDLLGTPSLEAMRTACEGAKAHILRGPHKQVLQGCSGHPAPPGTASSGHTSGFHILILFPWLLVINTCHEGLLSELSVPGDTAELPTGGCGAQG